MDNKRMSMISRLIQKELGELFLLETKKTPGILITVSEVRVTPDLSQARVFLSIFPDNKADELIKAIQQNSATIRYDFGKRVHAQLRIIPELIFLKDDSEKIISRIDELLKQ